MIVNVKFEESTSEIPVRFDDLQIITNGVPPEEVDKLVADAERKGHETGKQEAVENLPAGYVKVDPAWTAFDQFCYSRPSMIKNLKYSDTENGTRFLAAFSTITYHTTNEDVVVPRLDYRNGQIFTNMFIYSDRIVEIGEMDISNATSTSNMFNGCTGLKKILFVKGCIKLSMNFTYCRLLDDASIQSIIDGLADMTGKTAQTLSFHADVGAKLTEAQKAAITAKNWTLVY